MLGSSYNQIKDFELRSKCLCLFDVHIFPVLHLNLAILYAMQ